MTFQVSDLKEKIFLKLLNDKSNPIELSTIKGSLQFQYFDHSNSLCTRATKAIVNYTSIREYQWNFFPRKEFAYLSQIRYSLVVILKLNSVSEVQYKDMIIDRWWKVSTGIIDVVKSEV